jgi:aryl-alcohol dehydrogenase-like predicted oxidoreductase
VPIPTSIPTQVTLAGRSVRRVGYGAMQLTDIEGFVVGPDEAASLVRAALAQGADHVDTAEFYGRGELNRLLGRELAGEDVLVATKIGARYDPRTRLRPAQRPAELRADVDANLASLRTDRLDLVYLRRADFPPGIIATGDQVVDLDDQLAELTALRDVGKIAALGLSNVSAVQLESALDADIVAVQNAHSLADRSVEDVLDACRKHDIAWVPYFPLGGNHPGLTSVASLPEVVTAAAELAITPSRLGLAWHLHHYERTLLIPGTRSPAHLAENMAVAEVGLPPEILARLSPEPPVRPRAGA